MLYEVITFPEQDAISELEIAKEKTEFAFNKDYKVWRADYKTYKSSQEQEFLNVKLSDIQPNQLIGMPLLVELDNNRITSYNVCYTKLLRTEAPRGPGRRSRRCA